MSRRSILPTFTCLLMLCGLATFLPSQVAAYHCCSCMAPCAKGCGCRGYGHCSSCRGPVSDGSSIGATALNEPSLTVGGHLNSGLFSTSPSNIADRFLNLVRGGSRALGTIAFTVANSVDPAVWCPGHHGGFVGMERVSPFAGVK